MIWPDNRFPSAFTGLQVIESVYAVKDGAPVIVRRSWRARLLTWPWRPWRATRIEIPKVPAAVLVDGKVIAHPAVIAELRRSIGLSYSPEIGVSFVVPPTRRLICGNCNGRGCAHCDQTGEYQGYRDVR